MVALSALLPSSCTKAKNASEAKKSAAPKSAPAAISTSSPGKPAAAPAALSTQPRNLGDLQLTNHLETFINLGAGMSCTILPTVLNRSNLQLTMSLELKGPDGSVKDLSVVRVTTKTDKPFEVAVGDMDLTLTPRISSE